MTGGLCCDEGIPDPSGTCKALNLNSYGCYGLSNGEGLPGQTAGCDLSKEDGFPIGRKVEAFVPGSGDGTVKKVIEWTIARPFRGHAGDNMVGFIGCAA
ncbi:hypothetical protein LZ30DRAFT_825203 [Colletotrichum cereale]|nr:hypothetical protein LZ30DRAFT_825203 [Colletotrichum cereale]